MNEDQVQKVQRELTECNQKFPSQETNIETLIFKLEESNNLLSMRETENVSLRRRIERSNLENDQLLLRIDSQSNSIAVYEETEKTLKEEIRIIKGQLRESTMARDNVIEKLKYVSIETRELIDNCEKAYEESKIFRNKTEDLEAELNKLKQQDENLIIENRNIQMELESHKAELMLQRKLVSFNSESSTNNYFWENGILTANTELVYIEKQIRKIITSLNNSEAEKCNLKEEIEHLKSNYVILQQQNILKDEIIVKQNKDFLYVKATVDDYHSQIVRLDNEQKDCHERVSKLNSYLETINSDSFDLSEYMQFKNSLMKFGTIENMESLLAKLQMLQEIEQFFEKNLTLHVDSTTESESGNTIVPDRKPDTIGKIKSYLVKALGAIEKLNNKIMHLRTEYENKLQTKTVEITTLRHVLSNTVLYNKILEQTLQQYKDNVQLDKANSTETDELLIVNETLLDGFDTLKRLYKISDRSNCFLYAKSEQLKLCFRLIKIYFGKLHENSNYSPFLEKLNGVFVLMNDIFEEINKNEPNCQKLLECQQVIEKCERSLITKDYLKNTVENMSHEVKRLTNKVEHEIAEKVREIEQLRYEVDMTKTDNRDLVEKIKNCNSEIISLSTENYDLNERLENFTEITKKYEILEQKFETMRKSSLNTNYGTKNMTKIKEINGLCSSLKAENNNLRQLAIAYFQECENTLAKIRNLISTSPSAQVKDHQDLDVLDRKCRNINMNQDNLKQSITQFREQISNNLLAIGEALHQGMTPRSANFEYLSRMRDTCKCMRAENKCLKSDLDLFIRTMFDDALPRLHSTCNELLENFTKQNEENRNVSRRLMSIQAATKDINVCSKSICEEFKLMVAEFLNQFQIVVGNIQSLILFTVENIKSSFAISNDEMIKEMQEMNSELKKRGEVISNLTQSLTLEEKGKSNLTEQLEKKDIELAYVIVEMNNLREVAQKKDNLVQNVKEELEVVENRYSSEIRQETKRVKDLTAEMEDLKSQIRAKDDLILSLNNEVTRQKDVHDGDASSVGTISKTDETSRLKDVEDSFEERYTKLRIIALKMKKNISELTLQLNLEKSEKTALQNKVICLTEQAKRNHILQEECDKLNDDLELKTNELRELKKIIIESDRTNEDMKNHMGDLNTRLQQSEKHMFTMQNEKLELETKLANFVKQLDSINKEKAAQEILRKEKEKEMEQLKQKLKEIDESKLKILNELAEAKLEIRKQGAFSLEIRDYEKTISDLSTELEESKINIEELTNKLVTSVNENASLIARIKQLGDQVTSFANSNKTADEQILILNKKLSMCEQVLGEKETRLKEAVQQSLQEQSKIEHLTLQYVQATSEVRILQLRVTSAEDCLKKREFEFNQLKSDYDAYKIRAHNVLQKLKVENNFKTEEKIQSEITTLGQTIKEFKKRLNDALTELDNKNDELAMTEAAKEKLQKRVKELVIDLSKRTDEVEAVRAEQKVNKLSTDTLVNYYKAENEKLKFKLEEQKVELENALLKISAQAIHVTNDLMTHSHHDEVCEAGSFSENRVMSSLSNGSHDSETESIDEVKTYGKKRTHSLIPLDKLLKCTKEESVSVIDEIKSHENIKSLEEQVKYLTKILNESENNAARHAQQVALLKEEVRHLQRTFEREPHLQNTEYLKNVIFKFISLPSGDEKSQLVTVLETILKLNPGEKEVLNAISKGHRLDQKQTSWASLLSWY